MHECTKSCRYYPTGIPDTFQCKTHATTHVCNSSQCKTRVATSEGEFCYLTGRQKQGVECLLYDFTHSCTRVVRQSSARVRKARRTHATAKRNQWLCPIAEVTEILKRLYCEGTLRESTARLAAVRTASKLSRVGSTYPLERIMEHMHVGVCTVASSTSSPWVFAVASAITSFANKLKLQTTSCAGAAAFPVLFTAVVASKMVLGESIGTNIVIPKVKWIGRHGFSDVHFNQMNISCRAMSGMWRRIKTAAVAQPDAVICCSAPTLAPITSTSHVLNPAKRNRYFPRLSTRLRH